MREKRALPEVSVRIVPLLRNASNALPRRTTGPT
jgi:hypothetical protein